MFNCDNCGVCCTKPPPDDNGKSYAHVSTIHGKRVRHCKYLDNETFKCKIYNERPPICRGYPIGGEKCLLKRTLFNLKF